MRTTLLAAAIAACLAFRPAPAQEQKPVAVAVHCAHMVDVDAGKLLGETTVVTQGARIARVVAGAFDRQAWEAEALKSGAAATRYVNIEHGTCLPGLIDSHTHLTQQTSPTAYSDQFRWNAADYAIRSTVYARRTLLAGFTTVRNVGDHDYNSVSLRNAINAGIVPGPRMFTAGPAIGSTGGHADHTNGYRQDLAGDPGVAQNIINSPEDAWKAVRMHYKNGADLIKLMPSGGVLDESSSVDNAQLTIPEIQAVVAAAHDNGFTVAAHAHGAEAIRRAVIGGVDSIEHGTFMNDEDMKLMKEHGTWYVPTIIAGKFVQEKAGIPGYYPARVAEKAKMVGPIIQATAGKAYKAGVKIAFGTDASVYPHGDNAKEFVYMVEAGMPTMFVIQAATTHAALLLKHEKDLGSLSAGKFADMIAVEGNPLDDVALLQHVDFVMKEGQVYKEGGHEQASPAVADAAAPTRPADALPGY